MPNTAVIFHPSTSSVDSGLQKPSIYLTLSPFYEHVKRQASCLFEEIKENLSAAIQYEELDPGFSFWSKKLKEFIHLHKLFFSKVEHIQLIKLYLSILSMNNLSFFHGKICFYLLYLLLRKTRLLTREDLVIDWKIFYKWIILVSRNHEKSNFLLTMPKDIDFDLSLCISVCSPYFSPSATQEILDEIRPQMYPIEMDFSQITEMLRKLIPVIMPSIFHDRGYNLWLGEFFNIWNKLYNGSLWEHDLLRKFSELAWYNMGYIDWEPWMTDIFTRILRGFSIEVDDSGRKTRTYSYSVTYSAKWIVAMLGPKTSCFEYLKDLLFSLRNLFHPLNKTKAQSTLVEFILELGTHYVDRVHMESKANMLWFYNPVESHLLRECDITEFVDLIKEYALLAIFNQSSSENAMKACRLLAILRPKSIVDPIIEKYFISVTNLTEPTRLLSLVKCLNYIIPSIVAQSSSYSEGQKHVLPILLSLLPGIDINDYDKISCVLDFYNTTISLILCIDCSSASDTRNDMTEIEREVCLSTSQFAMFIDQFLDKILQMIISVSIEYTNERAIHQDAESIDAAIQEKIESIIYSLTVHSSSDLQQKLRNKILQFVTVECLSPRVRRITGVLIKALVSGSPCDTLSVFLPIVCEHIETIAATYNLNQIHEDKHIDIELLWYLNVFANLLLADGTSIMFYKDKILSTFRKCENVIGEDFHTSVGDGMKNMLTSLCFAYPLEYKLTNKQMDEPFTNWLPIREWGKVVMIEEVNIQYYVPSPIEIEFACEFIKEFIYPQLNILKNEASNLKKHQRHKALTLILSIISGCFHMIPKNIGHPIVKMFESAVPLQSKFNTIYPIYSIEEKFDENLRQQVFFIMDDLLNVLLEDSVIDVKSVIQAIQCYSSCSLHYTTNKKCTEANKSINLLKPLLRNQIDWNRKINRSTLIRTCFVAVEDIKRYQRYYFVNIDEFVVQKLFDLSIKQNLSIRRAAQSELFVILDLNDYSFSRIFDCLTETMQKVHEISDDQFKGLIHVLLGRKYFFIPLRCNWSQKEKLWPLICRMSHTTKINIQKLIESLHHKLNQEFTTIPIIQTIDEESKKAASALWTTIDDTGNKRHERLNLMNIEAYRGLMDALASQLKQTTLSGKQQETTFQMFHLLLQKEVSLPSSCIHMIMNSMLQNSIEIRKIAYKSMVALLRCQKPPRLFAKQTLKSLLVSMHISNAQDEEKQNIPGERFDNRWLLDSFKPPKTQEEWESNCFLDKPCYGYYTWPNIIKYTINKRDRHSKENMNETTNIIHEKLSDETFLVKLIQMMVPIENIDQMKFDENVFKIFKGICRNFGNIWINLLMQQLYILIGEKAGEMKNGSSLVAAMITSGIIRGSKYWTLDMLNELWNQLIPFIDKVVHDLGPITRNYWYSCFYYSMRNTDPRRNFHLVEYFRHLIHDEKMNSYAIEASRWSLISSLRILRWRIPSLWCDVHDRAKQILTHRSQVVVENVSEVLSLSIANDISWNDGAISNHPNANKFFNEICMKLADFIQNFETINTETLNEFNAHESLTEKMFDYIQTVAKIYTNFFSNCAQPMKAGVMSHYSDLCQAEAVVSRNVELRKSVENVRLKIVMGYMNVKTFQAFIEEFVKTFTDKNWRVRRMAVDSIPIAVFCNIFLARPYVDHIHELLVKCLLDTAIEVRVGASNALAYLYQCCYIKVVDEDIEKFRQWSQTICYSKENGKIELKHDMLLRRHGGVLGLCAIVKSNPYQVPYYLPTILLILSQHLDDHHIVRKSAKNSMAEFRQTHQYAWHEHRNKFTEEQLIILDSALGAQHYHI